MHVLVLVLALCHTLDRSLVQSAVDTGDVEYYIEFLQLPAASVASVELAALALEERHSR